jgi:Protein of unknown function (DUF3570)
VVKEPGDLARRGALTAIAVAVLATAAPEIARGDDLPDAFAIAPKPYFQLQSVMARTTMFDQTGRGFQSRAGPPHGPGGESLFVLEPAFEIVVSQGDRFTHRVYVPVDIVTAASPDAIDVLASASARNESVSVDWTGTYRLDHGTVSARAAAHGEENYHAWLAGLEATYSLAEDNALLAASFFESLDWFDAYLLYGTHVGYTSRNSTNGNASLSQLLSPTTVAVLGYGFTSQTGMLSNGWNIVPTPAGAFALERLPHHRDRHAVSGRIAQYLPWNGAFKGSYRFYVDDWGAVAHSAEAELDQRLAPFVYVGATYRLHHQSAVDFFTTSATPRVRFATSDSDLAEFYAQTFGLKASFDWSGRMPIGTKLHVDASIERYVRTNDLAVNVASLAIGFLP